MGPSRAQDLHAGSTIEVHYTLTTAEDIEQLVWWPAAVEKICTTQGAKGCTVSGTIKFAAMHGFRAMSAQVRFIADGKLQDRDGAIFPWRNGHTPAKWDGSSFNSGAMVGVDSGDSDPEYVLPGGRKRGTSALKLTVNEGDMSVKRKCVILEGAIHRIESEMLSQSALISSLTSRMASSKTEWNKEYLLPLQFLKMRLRAAMEKGVPVPSKVTTSKGKDGFHVCIQEGWRKVADCTLAQFDCVADHIRRTMGGNCKFTPTYEANKANALHKAQVSFESFKDLASVFGPVSAETIRDAVLTRRVERGTGIVNGMRIIGCLAQDTDNDSESVLITLGHSFHPIVNEAVKVSVLCRDSLKWNAIEDQYDMPLREMIFRWSELAVQSDRILQSGSMRGQLHRLEFSITWKRECPIVGTTLFQTLPDPKEVLGEIAVTVPFVLVRDTNVCDEVAAAVDGIEF